MSSRRSWPKGKVVRRTVFAPAALLAILFAPAQNPLDLLPDNYKLIFDNPDVSVIRAHYGPHEKIPVHDHTSLSTVFVYLSDSGPVRIDHQEAGEPPNSVTRPPTLKGAYRIAPGIRERHSIENLGDTGSDFLRVELKNVSLHLKEPFRGKAPQSLSAAQDTVDFTNPALDVERIVCIGSPCTVKASSSPSLLIAFTSLSIADGGSAKREQLESGAVHWLAASQAAAITPEPGTGAHILRILLPMP